jgi:hypothetical protein
MMNDDGLNGDEQRPAMNPRSCLFTVRLWKEDVAGGAEYRGQVRAVTGGVSRSFRDWSELAAFMRAQLDEDERTRSGPLED